MPDDFLDSPESDEALYLARGGDVEAYRPFLTGDVFRDVVVPSVGIEHTLAMIIAHPCVMRVGASLAPRIQMVPVTTYQHVPFERWSTGFFRVFPLPNLLGDGNHHAAHFEEAAMVNADQLRLERRVCCLTDTGMMLLLQRYIHHLTRASIQEHQLEQSCGNVLAEAELLEDWNMKLVPSRVAAGEPLDAALQGEAEEFDAFVGAGGGGPSLREQLKNPVARRDVRRAVRQEITRRSGE